MEGQENDLSNEAAALADILKWSTDLPAWQRDALRLVCGQTKLEATHSTALVAIGKGEATDRPTRRQSHQRSHCQPRGRHPRRALIVLFGAWVAATDLARCCKKHS